MYVQFINGPYDGLSWESTNSLASFAPVADLPVSRDVLRALNGEKFNFGFPSHFFAVYTREDDATYRFHSYRPMLISQRQASRDWCQRIVASRMERKQ